MTPGQLIRRARTGAALTQAEVAARAGTSQATLSAYETGSKQPSAATLVRILAAAGWRLALERTGQPVITPTRAQLEEVAAGLHDVLALASALPVRHEQELRYPRLAAVRT